MPQAYKLNDFVGTPNKIIAIITKIQNKHKHNDSSTSNNGAQLNHWLNLRYYRPCWIRGNNPKTYLQITQDGDEKQF